MPNTPSDNPFENWGNDAEGEVKEPGLFNFEGPTAEEVGPTPEWFTPAVLTHSNQELSPEVYWFFADPPPEIGTLRTAYSTRKFRGSVISGRDTSHWYEPGMDECSFVGSKGIARFRQPKAGGKRTRKVFLFADVVRLYAQESFSILAGDALFQFIQETPEPAVVHSALDCSNPAYGYSECNYVWQGKDGTAAFECSGRGQDPVACVKECNRFKVPPDAYEPRLMFMRSAEAAWTGRMLPHALKAVEDGKGVLFRIKDSNQSLRFQADSVTYQPESGEPIVVPYRDTEFATEGSMFIFRRKNARQGAAGLLRGRDAESRWEAHTIGNLMLLGELLAGLKPVGHPESVVEMLLSLTRRDPALVEELLRKAFRPS